MAKYKMGHWCKGLSQQAKADLDGVQAHGLDSLQAIFPVHWVYPVVVDAAWAHNAT